MDPKRLWDIHHQVVDALFKKKRVNEAQLAKDTEIEQCAKSILEAINKEYPELKGVSWQEVLDEVRSIVDPLPHPTDGEQLG